MSLSLSSFDLSILDLFATAHGTERLTDALDAYELDPESFVDELDEWRDELLTGSMQEETARDLLDAWHEHHSARLARSGARDIGRLGFPSRPVA